MEIRDKPGTLSTVTLSTFALALLLHPHTQEQYLLLSFQRAGRIP